jgi:hypothetical protein
MRNHGVKLRSHVNMALPFAGLPTHHAFAYALEASARFRRAFLAASCGVTGLGECESIAENGLPTSCAWARVQFLAWSSTPIIPADFL